MPKNRLTKLFIDRVGVGEDERRRQQLYWDTELKGFGILISKTAKSFVIQRFGKRKTIGRYPDLTVAQARNLALQSLSDIAHRRIDPRHQRMKTLRQAMERYVQGMRQRGCSERSIEDLENRAKRHLSDWLDRPLDKVTRAEVVERHTKIGRDIGKYSANMTFRCVRAIYNEAMALDEPVMLNPCIALRRRWFPERRRQEPVKDFRAWWAEVREIRNPIRRHLQLFILLTGLRSEDARTVKWIDLDLDAGTLVRPKPKGGETRAFTIPLSQFTIDLLRKVRDFVDILYPGSEWVFPSRDTRRQITYTKSLKEPRRDLPSPHRLRDT